MRDVQVLVSRVGFAENLGAMRDWLDRNNRPLVRFETTSDGDNIVMKLHFDDEALDECSKRGLAVGMSARVPYRAAARSLFARHWGMSFTNGKA